MRLSDLRDKRVVMWGGGVEGLATAKAVQKAGAVVTIAIDDKEGPVSPGDIDDIQTDFGEHALSALLAAEVVIKTPGVPPYHPILEQLKKALIPVITATELWFADNASKTIGITGTKGKSTTASLLGHLLKGLGFTVGVGGNVGVPLLSLAEGMQWYVAELSSYQCASLQRSPYIAVFTSLFPEHLIWHGSLDAYYEAKLNLAAHGPAYIVANGQNDELRQRLPSVADPAHIRWIPGKRLDVSEDTILLDNQPFVTSADTKLLGRHNLLNIALCLGVLIELKVDIAQKHAAIRRAIQSFQPLAHRLELVAERAGIKWINDSLSTTPQSAIAALEIFKDNPSVSIIVGGQDRGISYEPLRDYFKHRSNRVNIFTIPDSGEHIAEVLGGIAPHVVKRCESLQEAVNLAAAMTEPSGVVLLSPAAPSFGRFKDYKDRGRQFAMAVNDLK